MSRKKKDMIYILIFTLIVSGLMFLFGYWEYSDYTAYIHGQICECHGENGFMYKEFFTKGTAAILTGLILTAIRFLTRKSEDNRLPFKLISSVIIIISAAAF